jgi:hypothetical protein
VISHVTHATDRSEIKEMLVSCGFYGPNMFLRIICGQWTYVVTI